MATEATPALMEGPGKGKAYFDRAKTVADTGNYDYAIDMYIEGLFREPLNIPEHEALRDISLRRKVKGGKPASGFMGAKPRFKGKAPKEQMLNAEWLLAKDPGNIAHMSALLKHAFAADYKEIIHWFGPVMLHANRTQKYPHPRYYLELAGIFVLPFLQCFARGKFLHPVGQFAIIGKHLLGQLYGFRRSLKSPNSLI